MTDASRRSLQAVRSLLSEPITAVKEREQHALEGLLKASRYRVVIFGAGNLGKRSIALLRSLGVDPLAVTDNDAGLWGSEVGGCKVLSPQTAAERFGQDTLFIVAIWNPHHVYLNTRRQLEQLGCRMISPAAPLYWHFSDDLLPYFCQDLCHKVYEDAGRVMDAAELWSDDESNEQYLRQLRFRTLGTWEDLGILSSDECYFPEDLFALGHAEVFADCGAYDGDSLKSFLKACESRFRSIIAIEADPANYDKLTATIKCLPAEAAKRVTAINGAVGSGTGIVCFDSTGGTGPRLSEDGTVKVECHRLDDLLRNEWPTHIKMDIEGAEYDSLLGAREIISKCRPVLAVCVYHTQSDLWRIPLLIRELVPDYRFHLRMYEGDGWQTVAYAIPPERSLVDHT